MDCVVAVVVVALSGINMSALALSGKPLMDCVV